jgi:hypothetical protein
MPQWLVRPSNRSMRSPWYQCDDAGAEAILKRWGSKSRPIDLIQEEASEIWVDGGGAVSGDEPKMGFRANDVLFGIFLRQVPFVIPVLENLVEHEKVPGCVAFRGWQCHYIFSLATRDALLVELRRIRAEQEAKISGLEHLHAGRVNSLPNSVYLGACSCGSGHLYAQCCGRRN